MVVAMKYENAFANFEFLRNCFFQLYKKIYIKSTLVYLPYARKVKAKKTNKKKTNFKAALLYLNFCTCSEAP